MRGAAKDAALMGLAAGSAAIGLVWISIWAVNQLELYIAAWAPLAIGLSFCAPLAVYAIMRRVKSRPQPLQRVAANADSDIADAAKRVFKKAPLAAVGLAALAGLLAVRAPDAISPLLHLFDEERVD